jgi:hypothetical protein
LWCAQALGVQQEQVQYFVFKGYFHRIEALYRVLS